MTQEYENEPSLSPSPQPGLDSAKPNALKAKGGAKNKNKKIANSLVALGSAAILSVYGIGYAHTQSALASLTTDAPIIAIATTAPTATSGLAPVAAYQSPLLPPTVAATPATGIPSPSVASATATAAPATATTAPVTATSVPVSVATSPAAASASIAPTATYKDGTYSGTGTSRHGNITASVVIQSGKIVSANITQCGTRYPCAQIAALPGQVVTRQSAPVDLVSGATDSSRAYQGAIQNALANAKAA